MTDIVQTKEPLDVAIIAPLVELSRKYPRNLKNFSENCSAIINSSVEIAESCYYCLPRKKKIKDEKGKDKYVQIMIQGASIRLAELMAQNYGNYKMIVYCQPYNERERSVTAIARVIDLETLRDETDTATVTVYNTKDLEISRRNAIARAYRNAIWKLIPNIYKDVLLAVALKKAQSQDSATQIKDSFFKAVEYFSPANSAETILKYLNKQTADQVTANDIGVLKGIATAVKEGLRKLETAFEVICDDNEDDNLADNVTDIINEELKDEK